MIFEITYQVGDKQKSIVGDIKDFSDPMFFQVTDNNGMMHMIKRELILSCDQIESDQQNDLDSPDSKVDNISEKEDIKINDKTAESIATKQGDISVRASEIDDTDTAIIAKEETDSEKREMEGKIEDAQEEQNQPQPQQSDNDHKLVLDQDFLESVGIIHFDKVEDVEEYISGKIDAIENKKDLKKYVELMSSYISKHQELKDVKINAAIYTGSMKIFLAHKNFLEPGVYEEFAKEAILYLGDECHDFKQAVTLIDIFNKLTQEEKAKQWASWVITYYDGCRSEYEQNDYASAEKFYEAALRKGKKLFVANNPRIKNIENSITQCKRKIQENEQLDRPGYLYTKADEAYKDGDNETAEKYLQKAIDNRECLSKSVPVYILLLEKKEETKKAQKVLLSYYLYVPNNALKKMLNDLEMQEKDLYTDACNFRGKKQFEEAEKRFEKLILSGVQTKESIYQLVEMLATHNQSEKADYYLNRFKSQLPAYIHEKLAKTYALDKDYFEIARKAEEEKNFEKAVENYKIAIERDQKTNSAITSLTSLYIRLGMTDEAYSVLTEKGPGVVDPITMANIKLSIFAKSKDPKYIEDVQKTYSFLKGKSRDNNKKMMYEKDMIALFLRMGEIDLARQKFFSLLKRGKVFVVSNNDVREYLFKGICNYYWKSNQYLEIKDFAREVIQVYPGHQAAKRVLNGEIYNENNPLLVAEDGALEEVEEFDNETDNVKVCDYINNLIENNTLEDVVRLRKNELVREGKFIGTKEDASRIIFEATKRESMATNIEVRSRQFFGLAKIVKDFLDKDEADNNENGNFSEQKYLNFVISGTFQLGNYYLYRTINRNLDSARYCLYQVIRLAGNDNQLLKVSIVRFICSYFCTPEEMLQIRSIRAENMNMEKILIKELHSENIAPLMNDSCWLEILKCLEASEENEEKILKIFYENVFSQAESYIADGVTDFGKFETACKTKWRNYEKKKRIYKNLLTTTSENIFSVEQLRQNIEKVRAQTADVYLNPTEIEKINEYIQLLVLIDKYNDTDDFNYKSETLARVYELRNKCDEEIDETPTDGLCEILRPALEIMLQQLYKESSSLYGRSAPQITAAITDAPTIEPSRNIVRVPVSIVNKENVQNADNLQITVISDDNARLLRGNSLKRQLLVGNGVPEEWLLEFEVNNEVFDQNVFTITLHIEYSYKMGLGTPTTETEDKELAVNIYDHEEFQEIENKFRQYADGGQVTDASMFFGRDELIENIVEQLSNYNVQNGGRSIGLYGQTRTGKSSLLYHIKDKLRKSKIKKFIIIDVGNLGEEDLSGSIDDFLYTVLDELSKEIKKHHPELLDRVNIDANMIFEDSAHAQLRFNRQFKDFCETVLSLDPNYMIVVMVDEFTYIYDWIRQGVMSDRFTKFWKAFVQNNSICTLIVGQDHMPKFINDQRFINDFGSTNLIRITYLDEKHAKEMMELPIEITNADGTKESRYREGALDRIFELTAGSAFLIMSFCAGLVDYLNNIKSVYITKAHVNDYLEKSLPNMQEKIFEPQFNDKGTDDLTKRVEDNKAFLLKIARISARNEWAYINDVADTDNEKQLLKDLEMRDVIIVRNGDRCKIKVELYKEWLLEKYGRS